jgi:hypothetical protein
MTYTHPMYHESQFPAETPCGAITAASIFVAGAQQMVRCTRKPVDHRGPHWQETEPLPEGCNCRTICHCKETS